MRALFALLLILGPVADAHAQVLFELVPTHALVGERVDVLVDDATGCFPSGGFTSVERSGGVITATAWIDDAVPAGTPLGTCPAQWVTPRRMALGSFEPGHYRVDVVTCSNAPGPTPCARQAQFALAVFQTTGSPRTVPALSLAVLLTSAVAMFAMALQRSSRVP